MGDNLFEQPKRSPEQERDDSESFSSTPASPAFVPVRFQLTADYEVTLDWKNEFTPFQLETLSSILNSPSATRQIVRQVMQFELSRANNARLDDVFTEIPDEEMIACIRQCLTQEQWLRWEALKAQPMDAFTDELYGVFFAFKVILRSASCNEIGYKLHSKQSATSERSQASAHLTLLPRA